MLYTNTINTGAQLAKKRVPVEADFWVLIFADLAVFAAMFAAFMVRRFESDTTYMVFSTGAESLNQSIGLINTLILLTSSFAVASALVWFRSGHIAPFKKSLAVGVAFGFGFVLFKLFEYFEKVSQGVTVTSDRFFEFYFTFTGVHLLHVVIGISLLLLIIHKSSNKDTVPSEGFVEGVACYWHMVDLLWLMLFSLFYLLG